MIPSLGQLVSRSLRSHEERDEMLRVKAPLAAGSHRRTCARPESIRHRHISDVLDRRMSENEVLDFLGADFSRRPD